MALDACPFKSLFPTSMDLNSQLILISLLALSGAVDADPRGASHNLLPGDLVCVPLAEQNE